MCLRYLINESQQPYSSTQQYVCVWGNQQGKSLIFLLQLRAWSISFTYQHTSRLSVGSSLISVRVAISADKREGCRGWGGSGTNPRLSVIQPLTRPQKNHDQGHWKQGLRNSVLCQFPVLSLLSINYISLWDYCCTRTDWTLTGHFTL